MSQKKLVKQLLKKLDKLESDREKLIDKLAKALDKLDKKVATKKIAIDSSVTDLANLAIQQGINYKILKIHNPWLRTTKMVNPTNKKYQLEIPLEGY